MTDNEHFGPFELLYRVGVGGMAETFLARVHDDEIGNEFVLKRILPAISGDPESELAFREEAALAASLDHPNIVSSLPAGNVDGRTYIPMEFVFGDDLRNVVLKAMARESLPSDEFFVSVIVQAARGLDHAHAHRDDEGEPLGLVHRDVSPPNIMIGFDGVVRMVDFGIARLRPGASSVRTGQLKGKFAYMSPEQAMGISVDKRSDIFCLATVLYELLTRTRLFRDDTALKTVRNVSRAKIEPPTDQRKPLNPDLKPILLKALARDPRDRHDTMGEFADELEAVLIENENSQTNENIAHTMAKTCGDTIDLIKQLLGENYAGPVSVHSITFPEPKAAPAIDTHTQREPPTASAEPVPKPTRQPSLPNNRPLRAVVAGMASIFIILSIIALLK